MLQILFTLPVQLLLIIKAFETGLKCACISERYVSTKDILQTHFIDSEDSLQHSQASLSIPISLLEDPFFNIINHLYQDLINGLFS